MKIEIIKWLDSYGVGPAWTVLDEIILEPAIIISVGFIAKEDENNVLVVPHVSSHKEEDGKDGCGDMVIPKVCIIDRVVVNCGADTVQRW